MSPAAAPNNAQVRPPTTPKLATKDRPSLPDKVEFVQAELLKLLEPIVKEAGCIQYDLHQDNENPAMFMYYEMLCIYCNKR